MTKSHQEPAQRQIVHQLIDWDLVERRRERYPAIGRAFARTTLKHGCESSPYYCHYMAWRLGTWRDESLFKRLEELLRCAEKLPDWKHEQSLLLSKDYADFWSLVWQLQVAEHLCQVGTDVRWAKSGPDLSVMVDDERWFVECYTPRKSFGLLLFLDELLRQLDSAVCTSYDLCLPFQLPQNSDRSEFLDEVLSPFLAPTYLAAAKEASRQKYPMLLYSHPSNSLRVYVEGSDPDAYTPGIVPNRVGSPRGYFKRVLQEAVTAKKGSNALDLRRPNLVVVNYVLSADYQLAVNSPRTLECLTDSQIQYDFDALAVSVVGIDERLTKESLKVLNISHENRDRLSQIANVA